MNNKLLIGALGLYGCLGFYRGLNSYDHYMKKSYNRDKKVMFVDKFGYGLIGIILYANPLLIPISIYKESYKLEVDIRNLEDEKKGDRYNELF